MTPKEQISAIVDSKKKNEPHVSSHCMLRFYYLAKTAGIHRK